jgi:ribonuclease HI
MNPLKLTIYTDGASRGNPGPASYGFTISDENKKLLVEEGEYIGETTNNVAEYTAVLKSFQKVVEKFGSNVQISLLADSKLVAEQLSGRYKIKSPHLIPIVESIKVIAAGFDKVTYTHIPREQNTLADKLANKALDAL